MLIIHVWHNLIWTIVLEFWTIQPLGSNWIIFWRKLERLKLVCLNNLDILPPFCHKNLEITKIINLSYVWIVVLWLGWLEFQSSLDQTEFSLLHLINCKFHVGKHTQQYYDISHATMCRFWQDMCYKSCLVPELLAWQTMKTFCTLTFLPIWSLSLSLP